MKKICIRLETEVKKGKGIEVIYIPDQTQILQAGKRYTLVIEPAKPDA